MEPVTLVYDSPFIEQVNNYDITEDDVHIDRPVSNILLSYRPKNLIADQILPIVPVGRKSDLIPGIKIDDQLRIREDVRAPGAEPRMIHFNVTSQQSYCKNYALGTFLTAEEMANAEEAWNTKEIRSALVYDILMLNYELRVANLVNSGSNCGSYWTTGSSWGDWVNSEPLTNALGDIEVVESLRGFRPNKVVFGKTAWYNFRNSDEVLSRLFPHGGGPGGALVTMQMAANLLEVDQVIVGGAYYNSAAEGATLTLTKIWHDNVLYYYAPDRPSKEVPSFGYSLRWNVPGMPNMAVRTFPMDTKKGRQDIHVGYYQDEKITDKYLSGLRTGVGSSQ